MTDSPNVTPSAPIDPATAVKTPAMLLMATGGLGILVLIVALLLNLLGAGLGAAQGQNGLFSIVSGVVGIVFSIIGIIVGVVILLAAIKLKKFQSYGFVRIACFLAIIPCTSPCCILGIPAGIMALQALGKPEVKAAFEGK